MKCDVNQNGLGSFKNLFCLLPDFGATVFDNLAAELPKTHENTKDRLNNAGLLSRSLSGLGREMIPHNFFESALIYW